MVVVVLARPPLPVQSDQLCSIGADSSPATSLSLSRYINDYFMGLHDKRCLMFERHHEEKFGQVHAPCPVLNMEPSPITSLKKSASRDLSVLG